MKKTIRIIRAFLETRVLGTALSSAIWRLRHVYRGSKWLHQYKESLSHPHRALLADIAGEFSPFMNLLEAGACIGVNLHLLARRFPQSHFTGAEINPAAVDVGNNWLKSDGILNAWLMRGDLTRLDDMPPGIYDIVLTDAAMMYIGPEKVEKALRGLRSRAKRAILLNEWHSPGPSRYLDGHWLHDYAMLASKLFPEAAIELRKTTPGVWKDENWDAYGTTVIIKLP